jgi:hypothetical protein
LDDALAKCDAEVLHNFNPVDRPEYGKHNAPKEPTVKRLKHLIKRARLAKLKEAILRGYADDIREAVLAEEPIEPTREQNENGMDMDVPDASGAATPHL